MIRFELLAALCSFYQGTVNQTVADLGMNQFVTIQLLTEDEVRSQVNEMVTLTQNNLHVQLASALTFLRTTTESNTLFSASLDTYQVQVRAATVNFYGPTAGRPWSQTKCTLEKTGVMAAILYPFPAADIDIDHLGRYNFDYFYAINGPFGSYITVNGFTGGLLPMESLLISTLDCLYDVECLQLFVKSFPALNKVCMIQYYSP
ncbi:unnamed protein product [Adineta steineri]|uniref:Uncharacterized protein n=1 Tax=Adineta steineri TaxID=433720 RepID=A0A815Z1D0_9BILA|nr:unnamed protein product [Adineta steineri]CAF1576750.1 unnamed protein product [Adineta steineri]